MSHPWYSRTVFFVRACDEAIRFYESVGFSVAWRHEEGGRVVAAQVSRNGLELILNENADRAGSGRVFLSLEAGEIESCVREFRDAGVEVAEGFWGMPVRIVADPDGNDLLFFGDELND